MQERETHSHPSYGMIRFSRISGRPPYFFGSELPQDHYIELTIEGGELQRDLSNDWYHSDHRRIIECRMTANQFSELITSLNIGCGVPCTLQYVDDKAILQENSKAETKKEYTHRSFKERMKEFSGRFRGFQDKVKEITKKQVIAKKDKEEINNVVESLFTELNRNIPFFLECFQKHMDKVVVEAKMEVENTIMHKVTMLGLDSLHEQQKLLK